MAQHRNAIAGVCTGNRGPGRERGAGGSCRVLLPRCWHSPAPQDILQLLLMWGMPGGQGGVAGREVGRARGGGRAAG